MPIRIPESDRAFMRRWGPAVRQKASSLGYTGSALARAIGVNEPVLQRALRGEGPPPSPEIQAKIAAIIGAVQIDDVDSDSVPEATDNVQDRFLQVVEISRRDIATAFGKGLRPSQVEISIKL